MALSIAVVILVPCIGLIAGQSTLFSPSQTIASLNQTATLNASTAFLHSTGSTLTHYQTSSLKPSSAITVIPHSSAPTTPQITTSTTNKEEDKEEDAKKKRKTAIIAASCSGGAVLIIGLALVIWTHRKNHDT